MHGVHIPDGGVKKLTQSGSIQLTEKFLIRNVFYVPKFKYNLLSISQLAREK